MVRTKKGVVSVEADPARPSSVLQLSEDNAISIAKNLRQFQSRPKNGRQAALVEDALQLAETIAALSVFGRKCSAAQAGQVLDVVEQLSLHLEDLLARLLAETR